jgi:hypothetical protein
LKGVQISRSAQMWSVILHLQKDFADAYGFG